jgi:hypothetical protein
VISKGSAIKPDQIESFRLEPGSHASPSEGVCVVELASVLAGEEFSDRPDCVCEVIAAYLRSWNDRASYVDRQRLRPYATRVIGSGGDRATTRRRGEICLLWAETGDLQAAGPGRRFLARLGARTRVAWLLGARSALRLNEGAGEYAARVCFARHGSDAAFRLLDRLLEVGERDQSAPARTGPRTNGNGIGAVNGNGNGAVPARRRFVNAVLRARAAGPPPGSEKNGHGNGNGAGRSAPARRRARR